MPPNDDILTFLRDCGLDAARSPLTVMQHLYDALLAVNAKFNLTRITNEADYWRLHVADSLAAGRVYRELLTESPRVADIGCGAGFPLLPLAWANPGGEFVGIEATGKKADFIAETAKRIGLGNVSIRHAQAREAARMADLAGAFDLVVFRAVAPTGRLLKDIRGLLNDAPTATIIAYKTPQAVDEERDLTTREAAKFGFAVTESPVIHLPDPAEPRQFVILKWT